MTRPRASVSFSWHRAACSTNAALDLQCRRPRSTSRKEPGDSPELAEIREAKDPSVVRNRGPRASRRHAGALPSHGHHPSGPRSASRRVTGAPRTGCRLSPAYGAGRIPDNPGRQVPSTTQDTKITTHPPVTGSGRQETLAAHRRFPPTDDGSLFTTATETCTGRSITARGSLLEL